VFLIFEKIFDIQEKQNAKNFSIRLRIFSFANIGPAWGYFLMLAR